MTREVRIVRDGYGEKSLTHLSSLEERSYDLMSNAEMSVPRTEINPADIDKGRDRVELRVDGEVKFAGIIEDVVRNGDEKRIIAEGWERLAERAEPARETEQWATSDSVIVRDAIEDVPELELGEIETTNHNCSILVPPGTPPGAKARKAAQASPGFLRFNPDKTVDYGHLGSDKTHYTLSPRSDVVTSEFEIEERAGYDRCTHLLVLGAGEQDHQVQGLGISDDFNPAEDDEVWRTYPDKSVESEEAANALAERLIEELKEPLLDIFLTIQGVECQRGDWFRVYLPTENIDENLQVVEHTRIIDETGTKHEVTLSNHNESREYPEESRIKDLENYNRAIEGAPMAIDGGGSRQPVNSEHNWVSSYDYLPGVVHEHRVELKVEGDPYRAYSSGAASGGGEHSHTTEISTTSADNADWESTAVSKDEVDEEDITAAWDTIGSITPSEPTSKLKVGGSFTCIQSGGGNSVYAPALVDFRLVAYADTGTVYHPGTEGADVGLNSENSQLGSIPELEIPLDLEGDTVELQARLGGNYDGDWSLNSRILWQGAGRHNHTIEETATSSEEVGPHTHGPEFGIRETDADGDRHYPSNCDVLVNGKSMGVSLGDGTGEFSEIVDIQGHLQEGANRIEVTSESLGHIQAFLQGEAVRRIHGRT